MQITSRFVAGLTLAAAVLAVACGGGGSKSGALTLRLGHDQSDGHPFDAAAKRFAAGVAESSGGAIKVTVFPAAQLGDSPEQIEGLRLGSLDLALVAFSHASQFCPELGLFGAPFLFENAAHFAAVFDGEIGDELDRACRDRYGIRLLATLTSGDRVFFNGRRAITNVSDLAGLKVRVMGGEADALTWQAFGAVPVPMPYSEMYSALQAGVIDGAENEPVSILRNRFYEAAANIADTRHLVLPLGLFVSKQTMDRLTPEQQAMLLDQARQAAKWERATMAEQNLAALKTMQEKHGAKFTTPDTASLREKGRQVQERVAEKLGQQALLAKVRAAAR